MTPSTLDLREAEKKSLQIILDDYRADEISQSAALEAIALSLLRPPAAPRPMKLEATVTDSKFQGKSEISILRGSHVVMLDASPAEAALEIAFRINAFEAATHPGTAAGVDLEARDLGTRCKCGHALADHSLGMKGCGGCACNKFRASQAPSTPAPAPVDAALKAVEAMETHQGLRMLTPVQEWVKVIRAALQAPSNPEKGE